MKKIKKIPYVDQKQLASVLKAVHLTVHMKGKQIDKKSPTGYRRYSNRTWKSEEIISKLDSNSKFFSEIVANSYYRRQLHAAIGAELQSFLPNYTREAMKVYCKSIDIKQEKRGDNRSQRQTEEHLKGDAPISEKAQYWLSDEQLNVFANKIWVKRHSPTWGNRKINSVRFGEPSYRRERCTGRIERHIGVKEYFWLYKDISPEIKTFKSFIVIALDRHNMIGPNGYRATDGKWNKCLPGTSQIDTQG